MKLRWKTRAEGIFWGVVIAQGILWIGAGIIWVFMHGLSLVPRLHMFFYYTLGEWAIMGWLSLLCVIVGIAIGPSIAKDIAEERMKALDKLVTGGN